MKLIDLLTYAEANARDVSTLADIAAIRRIERGDVYRNFLIKKIRDEYEADAVEAEMAATFDEI